MYNAENDTWDYSFVIHWGSLVAFLLLAIAGSR
jgi:hypothetical protein